MRRLYTTLGALGADQLGMILPHEHVFVDLRTPDQPGYAEASVEEVLALMVPQIEAIKALGVTALVECSTGGVGRRADMDLAVSKATNFPIVVPTGNYREPWIPAWVAAASEDALHDWMLAELQDGIEQTGFKAGWIKLSAGDDGMTRLEERILRAATRAAIATDALIGSHTIRGRVVMDQLDIIEAEGGSAARFVSIHTQAEPDFGLHKALVERGAWIEYDNVGAVPVEESAGLVLKALDAGLGDKLLISHDRGWFDPALPKGGEPKPYTVVSTELLPMLAAAGVGEETIVGLTHRNPFAAFSRP
ncbi:esterase [Devosia sp. Root685]|uniref:phosphotriesterase family protein n=1 Tax=Devosia sp. Root685 TaxID=1736587 RepID=UPI0006F864D1|nr:esterase [Devosia sp. Root685]KRA97304.1 esterase [Devosia sp. Root685]